MRKRNSIIIGLVAGGLTLATPNLKAEDTQSPTKPGSEPASSLPGQENKELAQDQQSMMQGCLKASHVIGMEVRTDTGERLGVVHDLIVNLESDAAPFAIVKYGGTLGIGGTRVAVPLKDLKRSNEPDKLTLATTKDQFESSSSIARGGWAAVANQDWTKGVDQFYGQPPTVGEAPSQRHEMSGLNGGRESPLAPLPGKAVGRRENSQPSAGQAARDLLSKSADTELSGTVSNVIRLNFSSNPDNDVHATVQSGVVTLQGKVADQKQKEELEDAIKAIEGVIRINDRLIVASN